MVSVESRLIYYIDKDIKACIKLGHKVCVITHYFLITNSMNSFNKDDIVKYYKSKGFDAFIAIDKSILILIPNNKIY